MALIRAGLKLVTGKRVYGYINEQKESMGPMSIMVLHFSTLCFADDVFAEGDSQVTTTYLH